MRFGGHETFPIREGWLHKGLELLVENPDRLADEYAGDWLGVGRNMAKAIRFWLQATELAEPHPLGGTGKGVALQVTDLGDLVLSQDPYFLEPGTWWALHVNLVNSPRQAAVWSWFFNRFDLRRFERSVCIERFVGHLRRTERRVPSTRTLQRDVACLLASYAAPLPPKREDPEDSHFCPLMELGLLSYSRTSGHYQLHSQRKELPSRLFGYALARAFAVSSGGRKLIEVTVQQAARDPGGPGRTFVLTNESLFEMARQAEAELPRGDLEISGLAGERVLRVRAKRPIDWLQEHYADVAHRGRHVA